MIIPILIWAIVLLVIANVSISVLKRNNTSKTKNNKWEDYQGEIIVENTPTTSVAIINTKIVSAEDQFNNVGKTIANEQKINILNRRIENIEKTLLEFAKNKLLLENEFDYEKLDFRLKVMEKELNEIKNPTIQKKTFFGKENDEMEEKIRALAFNSRKN
ncbi:MAG: hypothetical protein PHX27_01665 [Candidatus ainarchaeum sp.]|nr:hypothetical protein [Candidatus ainarchaeum sp.]